MRKRIRALMAATSPNTEMKVVPVLSTAEKTEVATTSPAAAPAAPGKSSQIGSWAWVIALFGGGLLIAAYLLLGDPDRVVVGALTVVLMLILMLGGIHIGLAMVGAGGLGLYSLGGAPALTTTLEQGTFDPAATWQLSVIPTFILMGTALWKSGLTSRAFEAAKMWLGNVPGGLALTTTISGAGLAASSGSTIALTHALGRVAIPEMLRAGYKPGFAIGSTAMAGTLGQLIPPSVLLVVYAGAAQTSVGSQLMAGIIPGLILALAFCLYILAVGITRPATAPRTRQYFTLRQKMKGLVKVIPLAVVAFVVIGGIASGLFTPTESAAIGSVVALVLGWFTRNDGSNGLKDFFAYVKGVLVVATVASAGIFLLLIGVHILTRVVTLSRLANSLTDMILDIGLNATGFLLILVLLYLLLGMFMDTMAIILLTVPILAAPLMALGVDMIWFGIFLVIMVEIGMVTPPLGVLSFVIHRIAQDREVNHGQPISLTTTFLGVMPFVGVALGIAVLIIFVPDLVTWLPGQLSVSN
ncbi:TRAP transporter large permease subunit [Corynebacterium sp. YIM 101645]|uniref:TRAP transporter large permease subunit n=1 Tax=Corynebacterium lemuris TaxID=1859292 RepID=A0ABT2FW02_9CORY|nr:TRAP transporter large permease subunit [Corynebacterium lemuris]MCS5478144.1 TRAP transporter large permease subunit [Corynebacterium lemuris]